MSQPMSENQWRKQLKKFDVNVEYFGKGWYSRGRPKSKGPFNDVYGIIIHHTGGKLYTDADYSHFLFVGGRRELPAPLCHAEGRADGTIVMGAGGRANHAGLGSSQSLASVIQDLVPYSRELKPSSRDNRVDGNANFYALEIDYGGSGVGPTVEQISAAINWSAAVCDFHDWTGHSVIGHREWTYRKIDPARIAMGNFRKRVTERIREVN